MLFCLHLKTGRNLVPTGSSRKKFQRESILIPPLKFHRSNGGVAGNRTQVFTAYWFLVNKLIYI